jgi:ABC-type uncharacterized transport system substrate-binding protein
LERKSYVRGAAFRLPLGIVVASLALATALLNGCASVQPSSTPVAILVSDRLSVYKQVTDALTARLTHGRVYALDGDQRKAQSLLAKLRDDGNVAIVAVGPLATRVALKSSVRPLVYCQDFHVNQTAATDRVRGVRAAPAAQKQLQAWKMLEPRLRRITMISGRGTSDFAREAATSARQLGIRLDYVEVQSDREFLYAAKRIAADVQGLWFAPDNDVLSSDVLREALAYNTRQGKQTLVFSAQLLEFGALLSVEGEPQDIADRVVEQLQAARTAPTTVPLRRAKARINIEVANQLGLVVPAAMQAGVYVF